MLPLLIGVLFASLIGSLHCVGMCGGLVTLYSAPGPGEPDRGRASAHAAYHLSRLAAYLGLGAIAGAVGSLMQLATPARWFSPFGVLLAGAVLIAWGAAQLAGVVRMSAASPSRLTRWLGRLTLWAKTRPRVQRASMLGLSSALLPCGWLYVFVAAASATGGVVTAMAVMSAFWLGTVPALLGLGFLVSVMMSRLRRHVRVLSAVAMIVAGAATIVMRFNVPADFVNRAGLRFETMGLAAPAASTGSDGEALPCCADGAHEP